MTQAVVIRLECDTRNPCVAQSMEAWQREQSRRGFVQPQDQKEPNLWPGSRKGWKEPKVMIRDTLPPQDAPALEWVCSNAVRMCDVGKCVLNGQDLFIRLLPLWKSWLVSHVWRIWLWTLLVTWSYNTALRDCWNPCGPTPGLAKPSATSWLASGRQNFEQWPMARLSDSARSCTRSLWFWIKESPCFRGENYLLNLWRIVVATDKGWD